MASRGPPLQVCVPVSSSYKGTSHAGSRPTLLTTCYPHYLFQDPPSKYSEVLGDQRLGHRHKNFGEDSIQPITQEKEASRGKSKLIGKKEAQIHLASMCGILCRRLRGDDGSLFREREGAALMDVTKDHCAV